MPSVEIPESSCPDGYTQEDITRILGDREDEFWQWMAGQTMMLCDGREYDHKHRRYVATECSGMYPGTWLTNDAAPGGHGIVVYSHDFKRFIKGLPIVDW